MDQYALQRLLDQAAKPIMEMFSRIGRRDSGRFWTHILRRCRHGLQADRAIVFLWHNHETCAVLWRADLHLARRAGLKDARSHLPNNSKVGFERSFRFRIDPFNRSVIAVLDRCI